MNKRAAGLLCLLTFCFFTRLLQADAHGHALNENAHNHELHEDNHELHEDNHELHEDNHELHADHHDIHEGGHDHELHADDHEVHEATTEENTVEEETHHNAADVDAPSVDDEEILTRHLKKKKKSGRKKSYKYLLKKLKKEGKEKKKMMKCSMKEKKQEELSERFHYVWKSLLTMQEEIRRLQDPGMESRLPLECDQKWNNETYCKAKEGMEMCSGRGWCSCGACVCDPSYHGLFCECGICEFKNGVQCGGPGRGKCDCGECVCQPEYIGKECECSLSETNTSACQDPSNKQSVCSGNGKCICNSCVCKDGYHGKFCEGSLPSSVNCEELKLCVLCHMFTKSSMLTCPNCHGVEVTRIDKLRTQDDQHICSAMKIDEKCVLTFAYKEPVTDGGTIMVETENWVCG